MRSKHLSVLVSGAAEFIGTHVVRHLHAAVDRADPTHRVFDVGEDAMGAFTLLSPPPVVPQVGALAVAQGPASAGHHPHHESHVLPWRIETNLARRSRDRMDWV